MIICASKDEKTGDFYVNVRVPRGYIISQCEPLPIEIRELITPQQGAEIIENAVLMAMGMERRKK